MKKQIFPKTFAIFLAISFLFLNISGVFVNQAQALDPTGTIIVNKFNDENGDGVWDDDEILLISYPVFISLEDSEERINPADTATNGSVFNNVPIGNYYICEEIQEGWENTKPGTEAFDWGDGTMVVCYGPEALAEGETIEVDFGNHLIEIEEEEVSETTTTTTIAEEEEEVSETTTTTTLAAQVTTTIAESISEEDELEEDLEETEESEEKTSYDWNWVLIALLIIVGGALLFSKK